MALGAIIYFVDKRIFRDRKVEQVIFYARHVVLLYKYNKQMESGISHLQQALDELKEG